MKRRIYRQILSGVLGILLLLSLAGCGQTNAIAKPDKTMEAFYDLIIRQDTSAMTDLGIDSKESKETLKTYQSSMVSTIQKSFKDAGVAITKSQAKDIFKAISKKLASLEYKVSVVKKNDKDELKPLHIEKLSDAKKQLVSNVIDSFNSAPVSNDMHDKTFTLNLQKIKSGKNTIRIFFPEKYEEVGSKLTEIVTNQ